MSQAIKLNLGCGTQILSGYCNVDKYGQPDLCLDLETFPWPWNDNSVSEVLLSHTLEHLGQTPGVFIAIIQEIYRVCAADAVVRVIVPHPRHDFFIADPTHVRAITPATLEMFSKKANLQWREAGAANTPLALYHNVDFEIVSSTSILDEPYQSLYRERKITVEQLKNMETTLNNIVVQIEIVMKVIKQ